MDRDGVEARGVDSARLENGLHRAGGKTELVLPPRQALLLQGGDDDAVLAVFPVRGDEQVTLATEDGRVLIFSVSEIPVRAGAARGVNAIKLGGGDRVLGYQLSTRKRDGLRTWTTRGREVIVRETSYKPASRGGKGTIVIKQGRLERCAWPAVVMAVSVSIVQ